MPKILISGCLLGQKVRYDGADNLESNPRLQAWNQAGDIIPICPEVAGGLPIPRLPAEIQSGFTGVDVIRRQALVINKNGDDVTQAFLKGAYLALALTQEHGVVAAILKARSPSCGSQQIYDGSFSRTQKDGMGVTAALLTQHGIRVFDEDQIDEALDFAEKV